MGVRSILRQSRGFRGISSPGRASGFGIPRSPWQPCPPACVHRADNGELKKAQVISVIGHLLYARGSLCYISKAERLCGALPLHPGLLQGTEYKLQAGGRFPAFGRALFLSGICPGLSYLGRIWAQKSPELSALCPDCLILFYWCQFWFHRCRFIFHKRSISVKNLSLTFEPV